MYFMDNLVHFWFLLVYFPRFGIFYQEKSGNPALGAFVVQKENNLLRNNMTHLETIV
jgi:hypothetical protein